MTWPGVFQQPARSLAGAAFLALLLPAAAFAQGRTEGTIFNGTLNRPVAHQEVRLLLPRGGMQQVSSATSDAEGRFTFTGATLAPKSFYLVSTNYHGVPYNAPAQVGSNGAATVNLTVYDSTPSEAGLGIPAVRLLVGAEGSRLRVQEEYAIRNSTSPPRAYSVPGPTFRFRIPADAGTPSVTVTGLMNMLLPQTPEAAKLPGEFSIHYALKPGITLVTIQYETAYNAAGVAIRDGASYPIEQAELYVYPSSLTVAAPGFQPAGSDAANKIQKYAAPKLVRGASGLDIRLSGESASGPPPAAEQSQAQAQVKVLPNSIDNLSWPALGGFLLLLFWALGVRVAKEWPRLKAQTANASPDRPLGPKAEKLLVSLADLDELFAAGKIAETKYWKERLELKARLAALLKKSSPALVESYAARQNPR